MIPAAGTQAALVAVLGLIFGSFANVCIHRIPEGESVVTPRSRCPRCRVPIRWHDNLPLLSWMILRGKCRRCGAPIPWSYPLVEAAMAAGFLTVWLLHGVSLDGAAAAWLFFSCVVLWGIDSRHFILPDTVTVTGIVAGAAFAAGRGIARLGSAGEASGADLLLGDALDLPPLAWGSLAGALVGAAIPLAARGAYRIVRRLRGGRAPGRPAGASRAETPGAEAEAPVADAAARGVRSEAASAAPQPHEDIAFAALEEGMGLGDVKMLAMVGAFLGPRAVLITILAGSISGCLVVIPWLLATRRGLRTPIPFGPFLAFGAILALFAGDALAEGYQRLLLGMLG